MILNANDRYSATNLPAVGERVVYAPQGINLKGAGVVTGHDTRGKETRIVVKLDTGAEATVFAKSLFREPRPTRGRTEL